MAARFFSFRRFSTRLLLLVLGLLAAALLSTYLLVARANRANAIAHIEDRLAGDVKVFWASIDFRKRFFAEGAKVVSRDWPIRTLYLQPELDLKTLRTTLESYAARLNAPVFATFDVDGVMLATTNDHLTDESCGPFRYLIRGAEENGWEQNSDFGYLEGKLNVLIVVPLYAPEPNVIGWFGIAFPIDDSFARDLKATTQTEVTFTSGLSEDRKRVLASTLTAPLAQQVADQAPLELKDDGAVMLTDLGGEQYVTLYAPLALLAEAPARITLQRSLEAELAPARRLEQTMLLILLTALIAASLIALAVARGVSQPVQALAGHTRRVAAGDYTARIALDREDELGQLATAFNQMTAGLAERDRVRNLLGKVVSPEIATQLLHSDLKLGGEEREVTILFSDLRDFTSLSEKMPPTEVLTLLNRYLDRMSAIIEQHGGVIDKYIGDAIMALFGAPVALADGPARAVAAARDMARALEVLNAELRAEGRPALAFGIGINTARVVAGNMGSSSRLNYTVIGDGVNLASRLESLTKDPAYATPIIVSEATLGAIHPRPVARELGEVTVKGKSNAVKIFALTARGETKPPYSV
ncbi:Adenylate cyclase 1 [Lacunisphaera limnophila]|uniref:Adenylate cyclase 1 n=1 Tax=Lacunisphaera limnophila TaxID=1838286 RepID=A0A1D8AVV0_9BACT|nr:adenylate/guanylate cyclase domain-containing protein [Lacunisphaera limnophila]AOS45024.1 Adenylate cyclase 1 [Lacunisphaera limnophila]